MAEQEPYHVGDVAVLTATFRDVVTGALVNPTTVVLKVRRPDGTSAALGGVTNPSVGVFEGEHEFTVPGDHWWSAQGTAGAKAYGHARLSVLPQRT